PPPPYSSYQGGYPYQQPPPPNPYQQGYGQPQDNYQAGPSPYLPHAQSPPHENYGPHGMMQQPWGEQANRGHFPPHFEGGEHGHHE
ncbi:unnamed protein product, partial [Rotaria magnacalcarata]